MSTDGSHLCEQNLWRAVILQMFTDAATVSSTNSTMLHARSQAIRWLKGNSRDFVTVCDFAGWEPQLVRNVFMMHEASLADGGVFPKSSLKFKSKLLALHQSAARERKVFSEALNADA